MLTECLAVHYFFLAFFCISLGNLPIHPFPFSLPISRLSQPRSSPPPLCMSFPIGKDAIPFSVYNIVFSLILNKRLTFPIFFIII